MTALVFRLELPLGLAPSLNVYASWKPWQRANLRAQLLAEVSQAALGYPRCHLGIVRGPTRRKGMPGPVIVEGNARRRRVVVMRYSSTQPDEVSADSIGGKCPIDVLVRVGILRDDNAKWCEREARWERAAPGAGRVVIEVHEIETETAT